MRGCATQVSRAVGNTRSLTLCEKQSRATCSGQAGVAHQVAVTFARGAASLVEGPDHQALATATVARREDVRNAGLIFAVIRPDVGARIAFNPERVEQRLFRPEEAHGQQDQLRRQHLFGARHFFGHELAFLVLLPFDLNGLNRFDVTGLVGDELFGRREVNARIGAEFGGRFLLPVIEAMNLRPFRPGIVLGAFQWRLGQNFDLHQAPAAMAHRGPDAVGAGIAAADDDHVFARGGNEVAVSVSVQQAPGVRREEIHGEMNSFELAAFDGQIAGFRRAGAENNGVEIVEQLPGGKRFAHVTAADKLDALLLEDVDAAQDDFLLVELHVRDAVHEQAARSIGAFEDRHRMSGAIELGRGAETGRSRADDGNLLAGAHLGRFGSDPAFVPALVDDGTLDVLDGDGRCVDAEDTRAFAGGRADAAGELREIVGLMQQVDRPAPKAEINQVVPFRDQIVDGATGSHAAEQRAGVTERYAAIHAAGPLLPSLAAS